MIRFLYSYKFVRSTLVYWIRTHVVSPGSGPASFRLDPDPHHFAWIRTRVVSPGSSDPRHFAWIRTRASFRLDLQTHVISPGSGLA